MGKDVLSFGTLVLDDPVVNRILFKFDNSGVMRELARHCSR